MWCTRYRFWTAQWQPIAAHATDKGTVGADWTYPSHLNASAVAMRLRRVPESRNAGEILKGSTG